MMSGAGTDDRPRHGVIAAEHMFNDHCLDTARTNLLAIALAPGTPPEGPIAAVRRQLGEDFDPGFRIGRDVRDYELRDIRRDFLVFDVILLLTAALAGLGVLNGQLLSALERAKEWEASLGSWVPFETRMVVARMRDGPCTE